MKNHLIIFQKILDGNLSCHFRWPYSCLPNEHAGTDDRFSAIGWQERADCRKRKSENAKTNGQFFTFDANNLYFFLYPCVLHVSYRCS